MYGSYAGVLILYIAIYIVQACVWGWATNKIVENKGYSENWFWWGFFFGLIALIVALTKPDIRVQQTTYTPMYGNVSNNSSSLYREKRVATGTEWQCAYCRRINQAFVGTCACGHSRSETEEKKRLDHIAAQEFSNAHTDSSQSTFEDFVAPLKEEHPVFSAETNKAQQSQISSVKQTEEEKVNAIRQYKALMDEGIISPEEFETKKKDLLGL